MNQKIGAIETEYSGIRFRSRLEARWAVFFDQCGMEWKYEPQGFEAGGHRYLPDFYLPGPKTWCEVKGDSEAIAHDAEKISAVMSSGALPGGELLLLSDIPRNATSVDMLVAHPLLVFLPDKGRIDRQWGVFMEIGKGDPVDLYGLGPAALLANLMGVFIVEGITPGSVDGHWSAKAATIKIPYRFGARVVNAYQAAASSRFEHGQKGAI